MGKPNVVRDDIIREEEMIQTLKNTNKLDVQALLSILWLTGARISEALNVKGKDIEDCGEYLSISFITLKQRVKEGQLMPRRTLKILKGTIYYNIIKEYINKSRIYPELKLFNKTDTYYWKYMKMANPNIHFHLFRHSLATLASDKVDVFDMKEWFGWKKMDMAVNYVHPKKAIDNFYEAMKKDTIKKEAEKIGSGFKEPINK